MKGRSKRKNKGEVEQEFNVLYDKVYVINLDKDTKRMQKMEKQLNKAHINYERFSAINGYKIKFTNLNTNEEFFGIDLKNKIVKIQNSTEYKITCNPDAFAPTEINYLGSLQNINTPMSAGEFGLWCSNKMIWDKTKEQGYKKIIIFEDDVAFKKKNVQDGLNNFISHLPETFDLAYIDLHQVQGKQHPLTDNKYVNRFSDDSTGWGTWAIVFSNKAITTLLNQAYYTFPIDVFFWCASTGTANQDIIEANGVARCMDLAGKLETYSSSIDFINMDIGINNDPSKSSIADMGR